MILNVANVLLVLFPAVYAPLPMDRDQIELPRDPKAVVVALEYLYAGGAKAAPEQKWIIKIHADGRVIVADPDHPKKAVESSLPANELQSLLRFIVHDQKLLEFKNENVAAAHGNNVRSVLLNEGGIQRQAIIHVRTLEHAVEATRPPFPVRGELPDTPIELYRHSLVEARLLRLALETRIGGKAALADYLRRINERLDGELPRRISLTAEQLVSARSGDNGRLELLFTSGVVDIRCVVSEGGRIELSWKER